MADENGSRPASKSKALVREFKNGPRAVDGIDLRVAPGEIYGFLGPNGAGKSTTVLMLTTLLPPTAGTARVAGFDIVTEGPRVRSAIGAALQEAALDPLLTGREHMRLQTALHGHRQGRARSARRRAARARRPLPGGRPQGRRLLGRDETPARPGAGARPPPAHPLPRRADHRPRHPEPHRALGRGRPARRRGRRHRLPHHPVPGGGRRARRPGRDHRPRPHRRRGHAGRAEGRNRPADGRSGAPRPGRARAHGRRPRAASASPPAPRPQRRRGPARRRRVGAGRGGPRARRRGDRDRAPAAARPLARRRLPGQDRPLARGRRGGRGGARTPPRRRSARRERRACAPRSASSPAARSCAPCASRRRSCRR